MKISCYEAWVESLNGERIEEGNQAGLSRIKELLKWSSQHKALLKLSGGRVYRVGWTSLAGSNARNLPRHEASQGTLFVNGVESGSDVATQRRGVGLISFKVPPLDSLAIHLEVRPLLAILNTKSPNPPPISFHFIHKGLRVSKSSSQPAIQQTPNLKNSKSTGQLKKRPSMPLREEVFKSVTSAHSAPTPTVSTTKNRSRTLSAANGSLVVSATNTPTQSRPSTRASHNRDRSRSIGSQAKSSSESHQARQHQIDFQQVPPLPVKRVASAKTLQAALNGPTTNDRATRGRKLEARSATTEASNPIAYMIDALNETSPFEKSRSGSKEGWSPNNPIEAGNPKRWGSLRSKKSINLLKAFQNSDDPEKVRAELELEQKRLTSVQEEEAQRASMSQENGGEGPSPSRKTGGPSTLIPPPRKASLGNLRSEIKKTEERDSYWNEEDGDQNQVESRRFESRKRLETRQHQKPEILLVGNDDEMERSLTPPSPFDLGRNVLQEEEEGRETVDDPKQFYSIDDSQEPQVFSPYHSKSPSGNDREREGNSSTLIEDFSPAPSSTLLPFLSDPNLRQTSSTSIPKGPALEVHQPRRPWDAFIPPHLKERTTRGEIERLKDTLESLAELEAEEARLAEEERRLHRVLALHTLGDQIEQMQKRVSKRKDAIANLTDRIDEARGPSPDYDDDDDDDDEEDTGISQTDSEIEGVIGSKRATQQWVVSTREVNSDSYE